MAIDEHRQLGVARADHPRTDGRRLVARQLRIALLVSGAGHLVHNLEEFGLTLLMLGQTAVPAAATALFFVAARRPTRGLFVTAGIWGVIVFVVGGLTVLPLLFLPFEPAQTFSHYLAHVAYALLQVPLIVVGWRAAMASHPRRVR
ncbi:MAG: hypothetical protein WD358_08970 [Nitriliruptoraceae bacterium]